MMKIRSFSKLLLLLVLASIGGITGQYGEYGNDHYDDHYEQYDDHHEQYEGSLEETEPLTKPMSAEEDVIEVPYTPFRRKVQSFEKNPGFRGHVPVLIPRQEPKIPYESWIESPLSTAPKPGQ